MNTPGKRECVGVVGLGLLGRGIAACFLGHGFEVVALCHKEQNGEEIQLHIEQMIEELVKIGGFDASLRTDWRERYRPVTEYQTLSSCSFVVESVTESVAIKSEVFDRIEQYVSRETVIASNSSAIPISELQKQRQFPQRFIAMHWAEPAHATRFMEIIRGEQTSDKAIETTVALALKIGKEPSLCRKEVPGFIVNRIGYAMYREALYLLESGVADAETIDRSMRNALGLWASVCGPLRWIDLTGGPELYARAMERVLPTLSKTDELPTSFQKLAADGARGIANGRGFFTYTIEEAREWEELYRQHAWRVTQMQNEYFPLSNQENNK